ncbi:hypothetical protein RJ639_041081 [Escallonia herrerae]|uniref:PORR domain-containing protein n=1 Tax=Escallonia herrerae TaxID=1293975 RepID=A0AA88WL27_9ASTE|nr:hypothetical protein RJ639_041081 [Escallonia herrerae]
MRLPIIITTFLARNHDLFDTYRDRIKPKTEHVPFIRPNRRLQQFLDEEKRINLENEPLIVEKACKLLMMSKDNVVSVDKLVHVKREFWFPNDCLVNLVPKYPEYFRLVGCLGYGKSFLELVSWNLEFEKFVIEKQAEEEEEEEMMGIRLRLPFYVKLPAGFVLRKETREYG